MDKEQKSERQESEVNRTPGEGSVWRERERAQTRRVFPEEPRRCWGSRGLESERAEVLRMFFRGCCPLKR